MVMSRDGPLPSAGTPGVGRVHKKNTPDGASAALRQLADGLPTDSKPTDIAMLLGFKASQNKMLKGKAHSLHMALAARFHNDVRAPDRQTVLDELLDGTDPDTGRPWTLSLLLAEGSHGIIMHMLLDPSQFLEDPLQYSFCRLRSFVSLLLEIEPALLGAFDSKRRTPLHCLIFSLPSDNDDAITLRSLNVSKEAIITHMCVEGGFASRFGKRFSRIQKQLKQNSTGRHRDTRGTQVSSLHSDSESETEEDVEPTTCIIFGGVCGGPDRAGRMCCIRDGGIALEAALASLQEVASLDTNLQFHAVHAAIEESIAFPLSVVNALSSCFKVPDSFGRTCLHLAVGMPFTDTKIQWARNLARMCPTLLSESCKVFVLDNKKKNVTPLQYLAEQRVVDPMPRQSAIKTQSYKSALGTTSGMLYVAPVSSNLDVKLSALEDDLKLACLGAFEDADLCRGHMYTENNEKEIDFPLVDITISKKTLDSLCQHYRPDRQLKSVTITDVQVEWDKTSKAYQDTEEWGCAGNADLYLAFHWLKQTQCVRKVFQVSVKDFDEQSAVRVWRRHSDKAIIECLKGLQVETWDWQRPDIPCSTIQAAAGDTVKTLYLYSSGLDAVLESWSSPEGLPRLKNLEKIYLSASQGLESREHAKTSATTFKSTVETNFLAVNGRSLEDVEFTMLQTPNEGAFEDGNSSSNSNEHETNEWLHSMDQFSSFMDQIGNGGSKVPVKVALIDDGVKSSYHSLDNNILCGYSWPVPKTKQEESKVPRVTIPPKYNSSKTGHGTVMAWYIRRMCPKVKLCVAKLDPVVPGLAASDEKVTFTVESAIKAIRWAIAKKVDIISMSWAIDDNVPSDVKKSLSQAIRDAIEKNILIFCANPDKGAEYVNNSTYPYHVEKERIFCIGAAGRNGKRWDWIDEKDKSCTYLLPGVDLDIHVETAQPVLPTVHAVPIESPQAVRYTREQRKQSGSSLACALAAGLAAMILHCSRVTGASSSEIDYLRTYEGMKSALDSLYPDGGASAAAAGEGQWLPVSCLPSGKSFSHISSTDKKMTVLQERVIKFLENMPEDYICSVPSHGQVTRAATMVQNDA